LAGGRGRDPAVTDTPEPGERLLTVARVRPHPEHAEVMFFELARICRLPLTAQDYQGSLRRLREAAATGTPVRVRFVEEHGAVIDRVSAAAP
jgi:hypothetical protein